jgi:glucose-1-phosphate adenylyltransferase
MNNEVVALILAGGKGTRLAALTRKVAKPAVSFASKYRIIDFPLSNCANSKINTVGILTQYESVDLNAYIGNGEKWGLNGIRALTASLAPRQTEDGAAWYRGTADAIYQNLDFLDKVNPTYVLILSGDHIYQTTYNALIEQHIALKADCTISLIEVDWKEASRFGIVKLDDDLNIVQFDEKPKNPTSNLASMGIYVFSYKSLRQVLLLDAKNPHSSHDFGKDVLPYMLSKKKNMRGYKFAGYWKDVGTINSLHEANMDVLDYQIRNDLLYHPEFKIFSEDTFTLPQFIGPKASVKSSLVNQGAVILGKVESSVVSTDVFIGASALVSNCVLMEGAKICDGATISYAVVGPHTEVSSDSVISGSKDDIILICK